MDMMPLIWPWARRCIHTKNAMKKAIGNSSGSSWPSRPSEEVSKLMTVLSRSSFMVVSSGDGGPVVSNWPPPLVYVPVILAVALSQVASWTWPLSTAVRKSEYLIFSAWLASSLVEAKIAPSTMTSTT